jgi:hypothetical protein
MVMLDLWGDRFGDVDHEGPPFGPFDEHYFSLSQEERDERGRQANAYYQQQHPDWLKGTL